MAIVELSFSALPAHVRTARLVAAAVARRCGVDDAVLDEVRLAVGEACSRAVELHRRHCPKAPVNMTLDDGDGRFAVTVSDFAGEHSESAAGDLGALADEPDLDEAALPSRVGVAVIAGLVDDLVVERQPSGVVLRMTWPASRPVAR